MGLLNYLSSPSTPQAIATVSSSSPTTTTAAVTVRTSSIDNNSTTTNDDITTTITRSSTSQVRHSGATHVRGNIRRVWRPRFLELWDNGLVRYYERLLLLSDSSSSSSLVYKYTLVVTEARILDSTTFRDMHVGLPRGTYGFCIHAHYYAEEEEEESSSPSPPQEDRQLYCAVSTLVEAQMWVVALRWAASIQQQRPPRQGTTGQDWMQVTTSSITAETTTVPSYESTLAVQERRVKPAAVPSRIVVAKVVTYRLVRVGAMQFEIAYEIHCLLVQTKEPAMQWTMLRTTDDLEAAVKSLCEELGPTKLDPALLEPIKRLPRLKNKLHPTEIQASLTIADSIVRSLVMDALIINSQAMKQFLSLATVSNHETPPSSTLSVLFEAWQLHGPQSILDSRTEAVSVSTDQYVKKWLIVHATKKEQPFLGTVYMAHFFHQPWIVLSGVGVGTVALRSLASLWRRVCWIAPSTTLSIRLDVLLLSWISATYLGQQWAVPADQPPAPTAATRGSANKQSPRKREDRHGASKAASSTAGCAIIVLPDATEHKASTGSEDGVLVEGDADEFVSTVSLASDDDEANDSDGASIGDTNEDRLSSPLPRYPENGGVSCWSSAKDSIFQVRGATYFADRLKYPSDQAPMTCRGVDIFLTDTPQRHIARHPALLGGKLNEEDTFLVNFLLPFGNFVAYFSIPPLHRFPKKLQTVWTKFLKGDQEYRDARLKLLPVVLEGPWIVKTAVGPGNSPALLGKVIPLQYFFREPCARKKAAYEVDVIITASTIAKGILSVVKGSSSSVSIAFAFIIEAAEQEELPETVLCSFQIHSICLDDCPILPDVQLEKETDE